MRLTRFRVVGLIAILGCGAAWSASSRAQTGEQRPHSTLANQRAQQADPFEILESNRVPQPHGKTSSNQPTNSSRSQGAEPPATAFPRQVRELSVPPESKPSPTRKKQVIDLRDRIATNPFFQRGNVPSGPQNQVQPSPPINNLPDAAIPQQLFDQAKIAPELELHSANTPPDTYELMLDGPLPTEPTTDAEASESIFEPRSSQIQPAPDRSPTPESKKESPSTTQMPSEPWRDQLQQQPRVVGLRDGLVRPSKNPSNSDTVDGSQAERRVPGETFKPSEAIPQWIELADPGQQKPVGTKSPQTEPGAQSQSVLVQPSTPTQQLQQPQQPQQLPYQSSPPSAAGVENSKEKPKTNHQPNFFVPAYQPTESDERTNQVGYCPSDFSDCSGPLCSTFDPYAAAHVYRGKFAITTQRPLVELWRPLYTGGVYAPAPTWLGVTNPMKPHFLVYGDMRTAVGANHNAQGKSNVWGNVLNLDMDLQLTSTERIHAFVSPLNRGTKASGVSFNDELDLINGTNFDFNTLFFEGDAGALLGGARGTYPPFDLPFTFGLIPLIYQNGVWANDAMLGAAVALPARHSRTLKWSNFDASLFWATDNVTSDAFPNRDSAADIFGTAWFIDAYEGYIEADYAFVNDNTGAGRSYHNISAAFTRRYFHKLSNSVRFIVNTGQENLAPVNRTADGHLLLIENSLISAYPSTVVPYFNLFYGQGRPQSLARAGVAGGILTNTGINFETDGITGYPTLDPTGSNTYGFASGINLLGSQFAHQLVLEFAMLQAVGSRQFRNAVGDEYGLGARYQKPLSHNLIFRTDHMVGFREDATNITGSRFELRWKF
jgi:hypothetical protein